MLPLLAGVQSTATALEAERIRIEVINQNIANANVTRGPDGRPYQRQEVVFESVLNRQIQGSGGYDSGGKGVLVSRIAKDTKPPRLVYNPGHRDANEQGMVALPNINVHEEWVDMIAASRAFEANLAVVKNARSMALQTLAIGKHS
jgi:flagellar basal-body rod protein FlgC